MKTASNWNSHSPGANGCLVDPSFMREVSGDPDRATRSGAAPHASMAQRWHAWIDRAQALRAWARGGERR